MFKYVLAVVQAPLASSHLRAVGSILDQLLLEPMIGENRQLVTDEPIGFKK